MSTEVDIVHTKKGDVTLTQYAGEEGICLQLTGPNGYIQLTPEEVINLQFKLRYWGVMNYKINRRKVVQWHVE